MRVKIKKIHPDAVIPSYAHDSDAGLDLTATSMDFDIFGNVVYGTGLAIEIPQGYVGLIFPRSSNAKMDLLLSNSVGVIDCGYIGEIMFKFKKNADDAKVYAVGDRVGQLIIMPYPHIEFEEVDELGETERGTGGFGSTNK